MHSSMPSATTRLFLLLGDPVAHSLSPRFQNAAMQALSIDARYLALRCSAESVPHLVRALCAGAGGGNVTVPHKAVAAAAVDRPSAIVRRTGACNTFWMEDGAVHGENTDVAGFRAAARQLCGADLAGMRVILLGAGGAAASALCALLDDGAHVTLLNRSVERALSLVDRVADARAPGRVVVAPSDAALDGARADLVVNATSLGLDDADPLPFDLTRLANVGAALDIVSRAAGITPWVRHATALRIPAADGREMLVAQGAAAFSLWFRTPAPLDVMRASLHGI